MPETLPWQMRETMTQLFYQGKSLADVGWPSDWRYDVLRRIWEKEQPGEMTLCLSDKAIRETALPHGQQEGADA